MDEKEVDNDKRTFLTASATMIGGAGVAMAAVPFVTSLQPSEGAKAIGAPVEVDISNLEPGQMTIERWRGRPVWVLRRTKECLISLDKANPELRDPNSKESQQPKYATNAYRSVKPEYLVVLGVCTHLGCSPSYIPKDIEHNLGEEWQGGFFCPCHGSRFDLSGRVYAGVPAPTNLEIPPYKFLSDSEILVGKDDEGKA